MSVNDEVIKTCCSLIENKMKRLLIKYHNTDVKIVELLCEYIDDISIEYNVSKNKIINYKAYEWYYSNFLNALLTYMFIPCICISVDRLELNYHFQKHDIKLSHVQIHDLIYHIYKLIVYNKCKCNIINYYEETFIESLNNFNDSDDVYNYAKKYIPLLKIIFKYGHNLVNKQQKLIEAKVVKIFHKRRCLRIISNFVSNIIWNPEYKIGHKRIKSLSDKFNVLKLEN